MKTDCLLIMQPENRTVNVIPGFPDPLMAPDAGEPAYYPDYKNDRAMFIGSFRTIVTWDEVNKRLITFQKKRK